MKILILCTGNTCRSPMAEGIVRDILKEDGLEEHISVESMGLAAFDGEPATDKAVQAVGELGIDLKSHRSRRVMLQDLTEADLFYVMTESHKASLVGILPALADKITVVNVDDPFGQDLNVYRKCRDTFLKFFQKEKTKWVGDTGA